MNKDRLKAAADKSTYVENALRHRMIAELTSNMWKWDPTVTLQVFNSEVDDAGFDIVLKVASSIRYVQLKQAHDGKVPSHCSTRLSFSELAGSCIVLMAYCLDDLTISGYRFFGNGPHLAMPPIDSFKASKSPGRRNAEGVRHVRSHYRDVPLSRFTDRLSSSDLLKRLFIIEELNIRVEPASADGYAALYALRGSLSHLRLEEDLQREKAAEREREDRVLANYVPRSTTKTV